MIISIFFSEAIFLLYLKRALKWDGYYGISIFFSEAIFLLFKIPTGWLGALLKFQSSFLKLYSCYGIIESVVYAEISNISIFFSEAIFLLSLIARSVTITFQIFQSSFLKLYSCYVFTSTITLSRAGCISIFFSEAIFLLYDRHGYYGGNCLVGFQSSFLKLYSCYF